MRLRPSTSADLAQLLACEVHAPISWADPARLRAFLTDGHYRHDRIWIAEEGGTILARAVWWGRPGDDVPQALDCLYLHPSASGQMRLAVDLLTQAHRSFGARPPYHVFLPTDWKNQPLVTSALTWRQDALTRAGLPAMLERLRFRWTSDAGVPDPSPRLTFRATADDEAFVEALRRIAQGSLDHETRQALATTDPDTQARDDLAFYRNMPGQRDWWRLAYTPDGRLVGLAIPSANHSGPVVGYLGVVPEQRGHGYAIDLLNELTRIHARHGARHIDADTDADNTPMADAFRRAGYTNFAIRMVHSAS
ncbi:GNAT family N-acetyltransferase [Nonomuraea jabiensis]|uniref:GNAT family N-acetyltransferase n=1 Tax=Nonomuraea jabiensis TaxID=882448 RepID=UPI0036778E17